MISSQVCFGQTKGLRRRSRCLSSTGHFQRQDFSLALGITKPRRFFMYQNEIWNASDVALVIVDYQEEMFRQFRSSSPEEIELNMRFIIKMAKAFNIPVVLSTVGVKMGVNQPTKKSIKELLPNVTEVDRTSMDAWEDNHFVEEIKSTGKKKLIFCALYTEICLVYPVVEALKENFQVVIPVDAVAGLSQVAHETGISRLVQSGAIPNTTLALMCELFRDWKSEYASKARPLIVEYLRDYKMLANGPFASAS
jgi:nicotinamidase-related amidase